MVDSSDIIAIVSLIISITAFIVAMAQALQQYFSSAEGYRRCQESVMGLWAEKTRRKFRWSEIRFEVLYETPVIFCAPPSNDKGPVKGRPIAVVDGSAESYRRTKTMAPFQQADEDAKVAKDVHTADDERASWVTLLAMLQRSEAEGREWEKRNVMKTPKGVQHVEPQYSICVQVQSRKKSWDYMPSAVTKAYATTTISHLVEMTTMLGMSWRAFDPDTWTLRAEGNGFIMTSALVQGLGVMVSFSVTDRSVFAANRTIPCGEIKQLAFGSVPSILNGENLAFGSKEDVIRTLRFAGCLPATISRYRDQKTHSHSPAFEVIAMLAQTFRLRGSNFKRIPNPTIELWTKPYSSCALLKEFKAHLAELARKSDPYPRITAILQEYETLEPVWRDHDSEIDIDLREAVHSCIDSCDSYLKHLPQKAVTSVVGMHLAAVIDAPQRMDEIMTLVEPEKGLLDHYFRTVRPLVAGHAVERLPGQEQFEDMPGGTKSQREEIYVTLLFRICCWWMLHDFNDEDVMILPPKLKGSRLPVHIL